MTGKALRAARSRLKLTQEELAKRLGVQKNTVWRWENEQRHIPETVAKLLEFLRKEEQTTPGKKQST